MRSIDFTAPLRLLAIVAMLALCSSAVRAQNQLVGIGFGGGTSTGAEVQAQWTLRSHTLHAAIGWEKNNRHTDQTYTLALWRYRPLVGGYSCYYGAGIHAAWQMWQTGIGDRRFALSLCFDVGLCYALQGLPLSVTIGLQPRLPLVPYTGCDAGHVAIGVQYHF